MWCNEESSNGKLCQWYLVHLDARNNTPLGQNIHHFAAVSCGLIQCLLEKDSSRYILSKTWGTDEKLPVSLTIDFGVLKPDRGETQSAGCIGFVHSQNTTAWRGDCFLHSHHKRYLSSSSSSINAFSGTKILLIVSITTTSHSESHGMYLATGSLVKNWFRV